MTNRAGAICQIHGVIHDRGNNRDRAASRERLAAIHGAACVYCGRPLQVTDKDDTATYLERERIIAGCSYAFFNLLPACREHNVGRSDRYSALEYAASIGADVDKVAAAIAHAVTYRRGRSLRDDAVSAAIAHALAYRRR